MCPSALDPSDIVRLVFTCAFAFASAVRKVWLAAVTEMAWLFEALRIAG